MFQKLLFQLCNDGVGSLGINPLIANIQVLQIAVDWNNLDDLAIPGNDCYNIDDDLLFDPGYMSVTELALIKYLFWNVHRQNV